MPANPQMKKNMKTMLIIMGILFGCIFGYQLFKTLMMRHFMSSNQAPAVAVSTMKVEYSLWQPQVNASGSLRAVQGVSVTTELAGMVQSIYFTPGATVKKDTVLAQLNASSDIAQLHALQATAELAEVTYNRDKGQFAAEAISKEQLDTDAATLKSDNAQVAQQAATVAKKTISAPFTGRLGISEINLGQFVNPGDKVVTLQQLDPIYVDFYVPQQALTQLSVNQPITMTSDTFPGLSFTGKITTIDPLIDTNTRNVEVEATVANPKTQLVPGMFASVTVSTGTAKRYLTLPQTAISFNPYGDVAFIVKQKGKEKDKNGKPVLIVEQTFVTTGETRGDQIMIMQGLKEGDTVVTSGQLKLKNGSPVTINNSIVPTNNPDPKPVDE